MPKLNWVRRIHEDGMHCAFTDLVLWKGYYYCCFRHAERHAALPCGDVWIIRSADLEKWEVCGTLTTGLDDRDPAMVADVDRLYVYFGSRYVETDGSGGLVEGGERWLQSHASYTTDGTSWHVPIAVYERGFWLWHPYRFDDGFYCAAYGARGAGPDTADQVVNFVASPDGLNWNHVAPLRSDDDGDKTQLYDETALYRWDDGRILAAIRSGTNSQGTHFMEAQPPYTEWTRWSVAHEMQAPVMAKVAGVLVGAGRSFHGDSFQDTVAEHRRSHTSVYIIHPEKRTTEHLMDLPSGGDTSYCGMALRNENTLLISYYSQHEYSDRPGFVQGHKPASIYLAELAF